MTHLQKTIKYLAIAFAIFLTVTIISAISTVVLAFFGISGIVSNVNDSDYTIDYSDKFYDIKSLDINLDVAELNIIISDEFSVEATGVSNKFICENDNGVLNIKENTKSNAFWRFMPGNKKTKVIVYLPSDFIAKFVAIKTGVGNVKVETLYGEEIDFEFGVGRVVCDSLLSDKISIEGGVGEIDIKKVKTKDIALNSGIGKVKINLIGQEEDYKIITESGIGKIAINGQKYSNGIVNKGSLNILEINSGIGEVIVNFEE
ncbi:MAG: DUF4097 family beta strand repeat-containing protein [Clostridia bacterium]|nr:DUF4097 family beta strand repeat-containing protein [Clostridia bacterium]